MGDPQSNAERPQGTEQASLAKQACVNLRLLLLKLGKGWLWGHEQADFLLIA